MTTLPQMKKAIQRLVEERGHVSFAEIQELPDAKGRYAGEVFPNVLIWSGLSKLTIDALDALIESGAVHCVPSSILPYLIDGATLSLPLAKSRRQMERGYKEPHWLPVVLQPGRAVAQA